MRLPIYLAGVLLLSLTATVCVRATTLYGLVQYANVQLVSIDLDTFQETSIGKPSNFSLFNNLASIDPASRIFYFLHLDTSKQNIQLIGLSLDTGAVVKNINLNIGFAYYLVVDTTTGDLIVAGASGNTSLVRVNALTNAISPLAQLGLRGGGYTSAFDSTLHKVYMSFSDGSKSGISLYEIDASTGHVDTTLQWSLNMDGGLSYDPQTQLMYDVGWQNGGHICKTCRALVSFNPVTSAWKTIASISKLYGSTGNSPLDVVERKISFISSDDYRLYTYNIASGAALHTSKNSCVDDTTCPRYMGYA